MQSIRAVEAAQQKFTEEILKRIPDLTVDDIIHLRQAVAGEVNKGRAVLTVPAAAKEAAPAATGDSQPVVTAQ